MRKNYTFFALLALVCTASFGQITVAQWNFNGPSDTTIPGGAATPAPSVQLTTASASLVGGTSSSFGKGNISAGTAETETTSDPPNFGWNTTNYPAQGTGNKTAGVQFNVNTANYAGISLRFDQRLSNKAGNTYVVQYTTNVNAATPVWVDAQTFTFTPGAQDVTGDVWYTNRTVNLSSVTALNNNDNAAFRIVGAFDPTTNTYLSATASSSYNGTGTVRYDVVTVLATTSLGVNQPQLQKFSMSPNPTRHGIVQLSEPQSVSVFDILGKKVFEAKETNAIDTRNFRTGVYIVKTDAGVSRKLIVE